MWQYYHLENKEEITEKAERKVDSLGTTDESIRNLLNKKFRTESTPTLCTYRMSLNKFSSRMLEEAHKAVFQCT